MKLIYPVFLLAFFPISNPTLSAQTIELIGGLVLNQFYDNHSGESHYYMHPTKGPGYAAGIGADYAIDSFRLRFTLVYETYSGEIEAGDGGLGGGYYIEADIKKSVISFGFYPLNLNLSKSIAFNVGLEFSILTNEDFSGTYTNWTFGMPDRTMDIEDVYNSFSASFQYGLRMRVAYDIPLSGSVNISPQYVFHYGLSNEFKEFPQTTKAMRHYLLIGLEKKI